MRKHVVIVGGGQAAAQLIATLNQKKGNQLSVSLVGREAHLPYQRPPLSKAFLTEEMGKERLLFRDAEYYATASVDLRLGRYATSVDRAARRVRLDDGHELAYDALVLATGARARQLNVPGINLPGIHELRSLGDAIALRKLLVQAPRQLVIVGGGYIGLELAASARKLGSRVMVLEAADRVLARVASPFIAQTLTELHRRNGVEIRTGVQVCGIEGETAVTGVVCADGTRIAADVVVVGIGVVANDELAVQAGLSTDSGIVIDSACRTDDPAVFAAGDCACVYDERLERHVRLESVPNAIEQANIIAAQLCGDKVPQPTAPWFWSDQYDAKLQMVGLATQYDQAVTRIYPSEHTLALAEFYLSGGQLVAASVINRPQDFMLVKRILSGVPQQLALEALADATQPLAKVISTARV